MNIEWKPGMVDMHGWVALPEHFGEWMYLADLDGCRRSSKRDAAILDYAHPSNTGHILAHVQKANPSGWVAIGYHPDFEASGRGGWFGKIDNWIYYGTLPDVLRAMVGRVSDV